MTAPAEEAAAAIRSLGASGPIENALILGSAFYGISEIGDRVAAIPYARLPGFPVCEGVEDGELIVSLVDGAPTAILKGCTTFYETGDPSLMATPIETLSILGAHSVLCAGLARSAHSHLPVSSIVAVTDHINFTGLNPLIGAAAGGKAMIDMSEAYDRRQLRRMKMAAAAAGVSLLEGVFMWFSGPSFETPSEMKVARQFGADLVGWTIAPEAILARRYGLAYAAVAVLTEPPPACVGNGPPAAGVVAAKRLARAFLRMRG
ncbi:MAG: phosphorylase [Hyphomicrobiales bacterium]|jgi:purine-nucleoside phosphorylase|nr:MAG: phosphorylase [Hyphomicrobiales bacterium]